jgi:hypothetical protein
MKCRWWSFCSCLLVGLIGCGSASTPVSAPSHSSQPSSAKQAAIALADGGAPAASSVAESTAVGLPPPGAEGKATVDTSMFFANVEVSRDSSLQPSELRLRVNVADGPFGELTKRGLAGQVRDGKLLVRLPSSYPASRDPVASQQRACSYVIDCDTDTVKALGQGQLSAHPTPVEMVGFTSKYISSKSLSRGFDIASDVAKSHEGDCSEHAVLLAAIARRHQLAARVVFGFAVLRFSGRLPILVGHAWVEIHDGKSWLLADAALADSGLERVSGLLGLSYLPVQILRREDAGFRAELVTEPGCWQVERAEGQF